MKNQAILSVARIIAAMTYRDMMEFAASLPEISPYRTRAQGAENMSDWAKNVLTPIDLPSAPYIGVYSPDANAENRGA